MGLTWVRVGSFCNRIAIIHKKTKPTIKSLKDAQELLKLEFDGNSSDINKCVEEIFSYSVNGPRDVIDLCNNVRREHSTDKITLAMVAERATRFSEEKLYALNGDFGHIYPEIPQLVQAVFQGFKRNSAG